jgi:glycosyltransferase involved in cell wall biosynthesis
MKITFIGTLPPIKALSPYCYHLADALSKKINLEFINFKNIVPNIVYSGGAKEKKSYEIRNFKTTNILSWYNPFSWIKAGLSASGEIIHIQHWQWYSSITYCFILPIAKIRGKKRIITVHNITPHTADFTIVFIDKILNRIIFPFADFFIVHNTRNKKRLYELFNIDEDKISIIPHGTLMPYQKIKNITKYDARKYLKISMNKKIILFFGYMWGYKGLDVLLKAVKIVKDTRDDIILLIAGQPLKDWNKYEKIIKDNRLDNCIIKVLKYIPDSEIEYYFSCADIVALPYYQHPFDTHGGVGALALSFKKPMVVTDVGGLPEYVKEKIVISKPNNPSELAEKIVLVLNDEFLLKKLSKDSEELSKELSWDKIADTTINVYKKTIS